jgi:transcriptional regulator with PAS, ATPase and Fis domain
MQLRRIEDDAARRAIRKALRRHSGNVRAAAKVLEVSETTLHRLINRLELRAWLTDKFSRSLRHQQKE